MTDRELLEAAAKAAGYDFYWSGLQQCVFVKDGNGSAEQWMPLTSDADAFRLMVDMDMQVVCNSDPVLAVCYKTGGAYYQPLTDNITDKHAATRRAIVRAAAGE